jgi:outer membrane receptor protein involved in Fe transport
MIYLQRICLFLIICLLPHFNTLAQSPKGGGGRGENSGYVYGKMVDSETRNGQEYVVIQIFKSIAGMPDSISKEMITGGLTEGNGDFKIDKLPLNTPLVLRATLIGYSTFQKSFMVKESFVDLGNLGIMASATLKEVVIEGNDEFRIEFDKRIYDVEKNALNAGGTGEDVLRNIPALQLDMDGNVTMRNAAPQIFVDGRPTTLSIDQIPADAIQRVEVISNPSAKYDASGGGGGIVNIILKKNRGMGYNGSIRVGVDTRPRMNSGIDLNMRQGKFNFFINGNYNQRKNISRGYTERTDLTAAPTTVLDQQQRNINYGYMLNSKAGIDWFADNRNTFTLSQSLTQGKFNPVDSISSVTDTLPEGTFGSAASYRSSNTTRTFQNWGTSILYKHLFQEEGHELTSDFNMNRISSDFSGEYLTDYEQLQDAAQRQSGSGASQLYTLQTDYTRRTGEKSKIELGTRGYYRHYESEYKNFNRDPATNSLLEVKNLLVNYAYDDQIYALYGTYSRNAEKWKYQMGLRGESSYYVGRLKDSTAKFTIQYPISLFPSLYVTRIIDNRQDIQIALSRKINRPGFLQLIPFVDYSDSLNVSRGNPLLRPEFTHIAELSYQFNVSKGNTLLLTAYGRYSENLIIRNQVINYNEDLKRDVIINTFDNAKSSLATGIEFVAKTSPKPWLDITANVNLYNSSIDGTNLNSNLTNSISSWWTKLNVAIRLPKGFTFQSLFDYSSKRALTVASSERGGSIGGGGGGGGMGGGNWGSTDNTVQGYVLPTFALDLSVRKEFGKPKNLVFSVSMQDVFRTRVQYTHSETALFTQDTFKRRDWQFVRFNLSWKFGKVDAVLFKRKNMRQNSEGMEG